MSPRTLVTVCRVLGFVNIGFMFLGFVVGNYLTSLLNAGAAVFAFYSANNLEKVLDDNKI